MPILVMSDIMKPISFDKLMNWIFEERKSKNSIFGVRKFYKANEEKLNLFEEKIENPIGPAAGPHTQLAQNIIAAYCAGSRFFELKTVQALDGEDLPVSKPCISAPDECYNVEWSTELRVPEALDEYIKAWFAIKLISEEFGLGAGDGFIFNMSVGYDLEGIKTEKIDNFIENIKDAKNTKIWDECREWINNNLHLFRNINSIYVNEISPKICSSITLSTLHGCPVDEIEKIATYLIEEKGLNTFIKCNPTLLGYEFTRETMDKMGYDYLVFDDHHFKNDLQFEDAIPMIDRLQNLANSKGLSFGVKLTNTFPVKIVSKELPGEEMYMSGRSLFPLSINLAYKLSESFDGKLKISFSGGADIFNIRDIFDTGIYPITLATTLLKPGGYERLVQLANKFDSIGFYDFKGIDLDKLKKLSESCIYNSHYVKGIKPSRSKKLNKKVPKFDCFIAPCTEGCPINQDITKYIKLVAEGKYLEALRVITDKNPLPFITGTICNHKCMSKCTRNFYEDSVAIRDMKLVAAEGALEELITEIKAKNKDYKNVKKNVAVVGGGPAGLATAYFLARNKIDVTIIEKNDSLGGIVKSVIPNFRIPTNAIESDIKLLKAMGVKFDFGVEVKSYSELREKGYKYVVFATGAYKKQDLKIQEADTINAIDFLREFKADYENTHLGKNVVIIGGGNTAMDAARAAKRVEGVESVSIVYRRTKRYMPADEEEIKLALADGVKIRELLSPCSYEQSILTCKKMALGEIDDSGRRSVLATDKEDTIKADTVIAAIGEKVDSEFFVSNSIKVDDKGYVDINKNTLETNIENVFIAGDSLRGPSTVVEAIRDARIVSDEISLREKTNKYQNLEVVLEECKSIVRNKKGIIKERTGGIKTECDRCLDCSTVCENCVDVCPNRANISVKSDTLKDQIVHIDYMCNECGNCETFCPYDSAPYKDKLTLFTTEEDFNNSKNEGFLIVDKKLLKTRLSDDIDISELVDTIIKDYSWVL